MALLLIAAGWFATGVAAVAILRHRGHDTFAWSVIFVFLGPLAIPLAVSADRHRPSEPDRSTGSGRLDVLVAHDGSEEAAAALDAALSLLGPQMTCVTLAAVVDIEAATTVRGRDCQRQAQARLEALAPEVAKATGAPVDTVVLFGEPTHAIQHFAATHGYKLIVGSSRVAGRPHHLVGRRVPRNAAGQSSVPILIGPSP